MIKRTWKWPAPRVQQPVLLLGLALALLGCEQDQGEPCQVDRDCAEGLECVGGGGAERSTCEPIGSVDDEDPEPEPDAATRDDAGILFDAGILVDAGRDAGADAGLDAGLDAAADEDGGR